MNQRTVRIAALVIVVALASVVGLSLSDRVRPVAVRPTPTADPQTPAPTPPPRPHLGYTPVPEGTLAPVVLQRSPARGAELPPDGAVELVFDRPMDRASVEAAFSLAAAGAGGAQPQRGRIEWPDAQTLRFRPSQALPRAQLYDVALAQSARATDGAQLNGAYQFRFATSGHLEVGQVIPADGAQDVEAGATITVMFSRPVVPLELAERQGDLPQPLAFEPPIAGRGEWLSTAIYVFRPSAPLAGGTTYAARVAGDLRDVAGSPLQGEYAWRFTTVRPRVLATEPQDGAALVSVAPTVTLRFNQPVERASAEGSFRLRGPGGDVPGALQVLSDTLTFTPSQRLQFDSEYRIVVAAGLRGSAGGPGLEGEHGSGFRTVPLPRILSTTPSDGDRQASPYAELALQFNAPIDPATVLPNLQMTPPLSPTQVYTYFSSYDNVFHLSFGARPSTDYRVQIGPDIADPYGNRTGQALDLEFRTAPLPPTVDILAPGWVATYDASGPARVGLSSVNVSQAGLTLHRLTPDYIRQPYPDSAPPDAALLRRWQAQLDTPLDTTRLSQVELVEGGGRLDPGVYLLTLDRPQATPQFHVLAVSDINLTLKASERGALVWANDLQSGQPVAGLALEFFDQQGGALGAATTDADGVARLDIERTENRGLIAIARQPFAAAASDWGGGAWDLGLVGSGLPELAAHIYTDRPIYRPGQRVAFKGALRAEDDVAFSLPVGVGQVQATIRSPSGEQVYQQRLALSQHGTFSGTLELGEGAALGPYQIELLADNQSFGASFQVAAYRPPEFEVAVTAQPQEIVRGAGGSATVEVSYFFGGPVAGVPVQWNILAEPFRLAPDWAGRYRFDDADDPWACWECWWQPAPPPPPPILSGSGTTDAQGRLPIAIPTDLMDSQGNPITRSVRLVIEASATGRDNQAVAGRSELIVHSGQLYIGLAAGANVGRADEEQRVEVVTVDQRGARLAGQALEVEVFRHTWENTFVQNDSGGGAWQWRERRSSVARQTLTTDGQGAAAATFTPAEGGTYRVVATARDAGGRTVRSALFVWVADDGFVAWRRDNAAQITLIGDKASYQPNETATILIPSPFQRPHWALITVERGGVLSHEVRQMDGNSAIYHLPLAAAHAPNVFVSVVLFSPPEAPGRPADFKVGVLPLAVAPEPQSLRVALTPRLAAGASAQPGEQVTFDVQVSNQSGQPVASELSLDLVDKAVLSLLPRAPDAIRTAFYARRPLAVATASGLARSADRFLEQIDLELERQRRRDQTRANQQANENTRFLRNDGGGSSPLSSSGSAVAEAPASAADESEEKAGPAAPALTIREQFADTAYWDAAVATGADGRASVTVALPDNLTTWVMRGVGLTDDTRVGEGTAEVVATKPLLVRPVTPRFFVAGDTAELAANVSNNTAAPLDVQVGLATRGLTVTGALTQTLRVPANGEARATWQVEAQDVPEADLIFRAAAGQYGDASRPRLATGPQGTLPVYRYSAPEVVGTGGQVEAAGARTEVIGLPPNVDPRRGELTVRLDPSLAAGMRDGLDYLEHYPYECTEQTVSRFLPNVLTARALKRLGLSDPELEARLPGLVEEGLGRLYRRQHGDGGWGWWPDDESSPHISAYVTFGMLRAREAGFAVREDALARGLDYLAAALRPADKLAGTPEANQQAWLLYVLAEAGRADAAQTGALYDRREQLGGYARALLAMALQRGGAAPGDGRIKTLLSDLSSAAILSATGAHWEEGQHDRWSMNTDTRSTAIILAALVRLDPQNQLGPSVVRWLMVARKDGVWETTQESAWAIIALTDWMAATGELKGDYDYAAWLNDREQTSGHIAPADVGRPVVLRLRVADMLIGQGNRLTVGRGPGAGRLYYTAHLRAYLPVEEIKALDRGVTVRRRYVLASCQDGPRCPEVEQVRLGDVIRVELSVVAPNDLYYVVVEDPLPAGAEAIDTGLATASAVEEGGRWSADSGPWWPWWRWYSRAELRDEKVALFAEHLPKGAYLYSYTMRATLPGTFRVIPTTASEMYFPEVYGRADGQVLRVR